MMAQPGGQLQGGTLGGATIAFHSAQYGGSAFTTKFDGASYLIPIASLIGLGYAAYCYKSVAQVRVRPFTKQLSIYYSFFLYF